MTFFVGWLIILGAGIGVLAILFGGSSGREELIDALERDARASAIKRHPLRWVSFSVRHGRHVLQVRAKRWFSSQDKAVRYDNWQMRIVDVDVDVAFRFQMYRALSVTRIPSTKNQLFQTKTAVGWFDLLFRLRVARESHLVELLKRDEDLIARLRTFFDADGQRDVRYLGFGPNDGVEVKLKGRALDTTAWNRVIDDFIDLADLLRQRTSNDWAARMGSSPLINEAHHATTQPPPTPVPEDLTSAGASSGAPLGFRPRSYGDKD